MHSCVHPRPPVTKSPRRILTLKTLLIAVTAAAALLGAAMIGVPSTVEGASRCMGLGICLSF